MARLTTNDFIERSILKHGEIFDYSLVNYVNNRDKVNIICPVHGVFEQVPDSHMRGIGCSQCSNRHTYTNSIFIQKANIIHDNKYDYTLVDYKNAHTKIKIICKEHGIFEQKPYAHLSGNSCGKCSGSKKSNSAEFIIKAIAIHDNKYDYSLTDYKDTHSKIKIICPVHGIFEQEPSVHLSKKGCRACSGSMKLTTKDFIAKSKQIHKNKYDYSLVDYKNRISMVKITCPIHGLFEQKPDYHLSGNGCARCSGKNKSTHEFVEECKIKHGDLYDYSKTNYITGNKKINIICKKHGEFSQVASAHRSGNGCFKCKCSKGELRIREVLYSLDVNFLEEHTFDDCRLTLPLKFDFYLPEQNIIIEYDGKQHFEPILHFGGKDRYEYTRICDDLKNKYCMDNNIKIIRIPYTQFENIEKNNKAKFMKKSFLTREYTSLSTPGTMGMKEKRSFMASKILELEDILRLDNTDIQWTENYDHTQGIGMDNLDRRLSSFQLKTNSHSIRISPSQTDSEKKLFTKWEFSFSIKKMIREYLFAKLKFYKTFASIQSVNTYYNDINEAIYEYIDLNILPRIRFDTIELFIRYYPLSVLQDNGEVALQYNSIFRNDLYNLQALSGENTTQYQQRVAFFKDKIRAKNIQLTTDVSNNIANIVYKQTESSAAYKFDYYFNILYVKA